MGVVTLVSCFIVFGALVAFDLTDNYVWARCVAFSAIQLLHNVSFRVLLGRPLFLMFKDRDGYENFFYGRDEPSESPSTTALTVTST